MKITKIELQKKDRHRYNLYVDDEFKTGIHEDVIVMLNLHVGQEITTEYYDTIIEKELYSKAKNYALQVINYRMRSTQEVVTKLKDKDYDENVISRVIDFLNEHRFLNDFNFAKAFIYDKSQLSKHSKKKIFFDLVKKGVSKDTIEAAFNYYIDDGFDLEIENLKIMVKKKYISYDNKGKYTDYEVKQKVLQSLAQKGFAYSSIKSVLEEYLESEDS